MTQFEKQFIGKGSRVKNLDIVRVSITRDTLEELLKGELVHYGDKDYLVFEVAALKEADKYGRTHTAYISKKVVAPEKKKRTAKAK
jgi:hypothetical protein